jgi:glutathione S-transferase
MRTSSGRAKAGHNLAHDGRAEIYQPTHARGTHLHITCKRARSDAKFSVSLMSCMIAEQARNANARQDHVLILYFAPGASSMAVHIALNEIGVPFERQAISFAQGEQHAPAFRALNPEGKVPTLVIDGRPLTEVAAILFYLAKRHPEAALLPHDDIEAQAQAISWMSFAAATLHPARRLGVEHAMQIYAIADKRLGDKEWAIGAYSIADIHLFRLYWRLANSLEIPVGTFPHLSEHYDRMMSRPAVQRTIEFERRIGYELPK